MIKKCLNCNTTFKTFACRVRVGKGKYCSTTCEFAFKKSSGKLRNENNPCWKGNGVSYGGLHRWLRKNYPSKGRCEICHRLRQTEWANRSGKYLRDINDYLELCYSCHGLFDRGYSIKSILMINELRNQLHKEGKTKPIRFIL